MAQTRGATGNAKPRVFSTPSTEPARKRATGTKKSTKANTSKKVTTGGVTKKKAPAVKRKTAAVKDKIEGAVEKGVGKVERKPGKKAAGTKKAKGAEGKTARTKKTAAA